MAVDFADKPAIVDGDTTLSYSELKATVDQAAVALLSLGVEAGDRISIWAPNCWQWIVAALAIHSTGATIVPLNTRYRQTEGEYILRKTRPKFVFMPRYFLNIDFTQILAQCDLPDPPGAIALDEDCQDEESGKWQIASWNSFLEIGQRNPLLLEVLRDRKASIGPESISDIMFTSGTTGFPKGVIGRHGQALRAFYDLGSISGLNDGDRHAIVAPFSHSFGYKCGWLITMMFGATSYPVATVEPKFLAGLISEQHITVLPGPPAVHQSILALPNLKDYDVSSLRVCITGGATLHRAVLEQMRSELGFTTLLSSFGLTECTAIAVTCRRDDDIETICQTAGRAMPGVRVSVMDPDLNFLPPGEVGEIVVKGYNVMSGYLDDDEATAEAITEDGWLRTGDLGRLDAKGYLRITGRIKDMFIVGGFNAYPSEIENVLLQHPAIKEVAVVGTPHDLLGEVGVAFVVLRRETLLTKEELVEWSSSRMANFKVPRHLYVVEEIPRNSSGKVLKTELKKRLEE
jgi:acyl-CoA synthetase (AMP-forming)/AMP-acid ligase II